jgi:hypothetical protein
MLGTRALVVGIFASTVELVAVELGIEQDVGAILHAIMSIEPTPDERDE